MNINEISGSPLSTNPKRVKPGVSTKQHAKDAASLTPEAVSRFESEQAKRFSDIKERIESGYYEQHDVLKSVSESMVHDVAEPSGDHDGQETP